MLHLHFANRQETLADLLTDRLAAPGGDLFAPAEVLVASTAMRRAVTLRMAQRFGIAAHLRFGFLAQWLWAQGGRIVAAAQGEGDAAGAPATPAAGGAEAPWQPALLTWRVLAALHDPAWVAAQPRLARYLAQADAVTRLDLAQRVAALVDQHITYRPDWLAAWGEGRPALPDGAAGREDEAWQAALWRRLQAEITGTAAAEDTGRRIDPTAAHTLAATLARLPDSPALRQRLARSGLPAVTHVFCLPTIAPVHLALLQQVARWVTLHVYAINPCAGYWFDLVDARRLARLAAAGRAQHAETGNRLLAAWGGQAQAQLAALVEACGDGVIDEDHYTPHPGHSLLARLQNSILALEELPPASVPLDAADRSIELHVCHSLTRELQVLHDTLLALFSQPGAPQPGDVLVVVPDLQAAAPLIDSVFGTAPPALALPFTITGRAPSQSNPAARALLDMLALAASRLPASAVFGLLQQPLVAARFGLDDEALARVHGWLLDAGVHWGQDGMHQAQVLADAPGDTPAPGAPAAAPPGAGPHSWADALDRLFLGHALPSDAPPFDGRLASGDAEGSAAQALGGLWAFVQAVQALRARVAQPLPAAQWPALLEELLAGLVHSGRADTAAAETLADLRGALQGLADTWRRSAPDLPLALDVVRQALQQALDDPALGGVPTGRITFSAMPSLRGLPYRMVCMLGLDDGAFPAAPRPAEFDLIAQHPRPGDRQRRADDRNLFLDLLLSARERVHLSHTGRSVRDNTMLQPSVLVSELLDVLLPALDAPRAAARAHLVVEHPLQAFDARAFQAGADLRQRSFHAEYGLALAAGQAAQQTLTASAASPASPGGSEPDQLPVADADGNAGASAGADAADDSDSPADDEDDSSDSAAPAFFTRPIGAAGAAGEAPAGQPAAAITVTLATLQRFWRHPARWLLQQGLGLTLRHADETLADDEPFLPDHSTRQDLARRLLPALLQAEAAGHTLDDAALLAQARAGTALPAGLIGAQYLQAELPQLRSHARAVAQATRQAPLAPHSALLPLPPPGAWQPVVPGWEAPAPAGPTAITPTAAISLHASFSALRPAGAVLHRYADAGPTDHLDAWLQHLALCAAAPPGAALRTRWLGRQAAFGFQPVADALPLLAGLVALFQQGQRAPLYFFPKTSWAWLQQGGSLAAARGAWLATASRPWAEQADAAHRLVLRGLPDPLEPAGLQAFTHTSQAVLQPLLDHLDDGTAA